MGIRAARDRALPLAPTETSYEDGVWMRTQRSDGKTQPFAGVIAGHNPKRALPASGPAGRRRYILLRYFP